MFNFRTQHLRGTTDEWANSSIIPKQGELVLEECDGDIIRIKIGNGVSRFSELKYVDENTARELLLLQAQIDQIVADDSIDKNTVEQEVENIRVGYDGHIYPQAGEAVRAVGKHLLSLEEGLADFIGEHAVNGLHYENDWLYLKTGDQILEESGVHIVGGGVGGGGSSTLNDLKLSYITSSPITCTPKDQVILEFNFTGKDSSGDVISQVNATWEVDKKIVAYSTVKDGYNSFDVTSYLKVGQNQIKLTVTDDIGTRQFKTWRADKIDLRLEVIFDDTKSYDINEPVFISCIPYGAVDKNLYIYLDGELIPEAPILFPKRFSGPSSQTTIELPNAGHGTHKMEAYLTAMIDGVTESYSETVVKNIIYYDSQNTASIIKLANSSFTAKQHDTVKIDYTVYDPQTTSPIVDIYIDNEYKESQVLTNANASYSYLASSVGTHTIKFVCGETVAIAEIDVKELDIIVTPVKTGLAFDFNPVGLSNDSPNKLWSDGTVSMSVSENFDWNNGGYKYDANNIPYLCVKAGTRAIFDYKLFNSDTKIGKEFKVIFKTTNVGDPEQSFLSCLDPDSQIGIDMRMHEAAISGNNGSLELSYSENDKIEFEFNLSPLTPTVVGSIPLLMGYEDGVATRPLVYNDSWSFKQTNPQNIVVGSDYCDVHIYRMKAYETALTDAQILNNFIADASTSDEMIRRYKRNAFYEENNGELDPETVATLCPDLRVYVVSAPKFTSDKKEKISGTTIQQIYKNGDPVLDNWTCYNAKHSGQGTSSNDYGPAGRNLDFIMNGADSYFLLGDGTTITKEVTLTRSSVPTAYLNAKVNIASSNNLTNAILAKHYNTHNPYKRPLYDRISENGYFDRDADGNIIQRFDVPLEWVKDTMEFHNCVIFIQETDTQIGTHREFEDTDVHFYALGNIGDSKKTDNTRLTNPNDKFECCVEIMDVDKVLSGFPKDTMRNVKDDYVTDEVTDERIYTWVKNENLGILHEKTANGLYKLTDDTEVDHEKDYYVDMLENDDFSEAFTYGWRYLWEDGTSAENKQVFDVCKQAWVDFYRFVTTSTDEEFKEHLKDYFVVESALYYYLFTTRYCMVDNRAKNTFWHYGVAGVFDSKGEQVFDESGHPVIATDSNGLPIRKWDLCWDYDNDTSLGLNNFGKQVYRYGLEDFDTDESGKEIFRQSDSLFFCRIRDLFAEELATLYNKLENTQKNPWNAETFIIECDDWQDQFSEELWRQDIQRKYIRTYTQSFINGDAQPRFLNNMANGKMKYHRRQWERSQEFYMASKYQTLTASTNAVNLRASAPESYVVTPSYNLTLTPCMYMYLNVDYGGQSRNIVKERVKELNKPITIKSPSGVEKGDIMNIWSASGLADIGDVSSTYTEELVVSAAKRLKQVIAGNATTGYRNAGLTSIAINTPLLETLNIQNVTGLTGSLSLKELLNLKKIYAKGSNISDVELAPGCKIEYLELPVGTKTLNFDSLQYITNDNVVMYDEDTLLTQYPNVTTLTVKDCPLLNSLELVKLCPKLTNLTLINVKFGTYSFEEFSNTFFGLTTCNLTGTIYFKELTGTQYTELKRRYPLLTITYGGLTCTVTFHYSDGSIACDPYTIYNAESIPVDPVLDGRINPAPVKESTAQYHFTWAGWSDVNDGVPVDTDFLTNITNDYHLYPTYTHTIRRYTIEFRNNDDTVLETKQAEYGTSIVTYTGTTPVKQDTTSPDAFDFAGWQPEPKDIVGNVITYAVYTLNKDKLTPINIHQFAYSLDDVKSTLNIVKYPIVDDAPQVLKINSSYIPDGLSQEYIVDSIGKEVGQAGFQEAGIEYVEFPETVTHIGSYSFMNNKLSEVTIPESVKVLGKKAFANMPIQNVYFNAVNAKLHDDEDKTSNLSPFDNVTTSSGYNVHIGPKVETIGQYMFYPQTTVENKGHISKLTFSDGSSCNTIEKFAFNASGCRSVEFNNAPITEIGASAFSACNLTSVDLPIQLKTIGANAFSNNKNLHSVWLPSSVTFIGDYAFVGCADNLTFTLSSATYFNWTNNCLLGTSNSQRPGALLYGNGTNIDIKQQTGVITIAPGAFQNSSVQHISLPNSLKTIGKYAFENSALQSIELPEGLTSIGDYAFKNTSSISNITLPQSIEQLGGWVFDGCGIYSIVVPENVTKIGSYAFARCKNLTEATLPASLSAMSLGMFKECTNLETVDIKSATTAWTLESEDSIFRDCKKLKTIHLGFKTTDAGADAIMNKAPWGAGLNVADDVVTVIYADKTINYVYNVEQNQYIPHDVTT